MRLATLRIGSGTVAAREDEHGFVTLPAPDVATLLRRPDWAELAERYEGGSVIGRDEANIAPVVTSPSKIVCCGHNYSAHIAEMGHQPPAYPTLFTKWADSLTGPYDPVCLDIATDSLDWEAELAVIVGKPVRGANRAEAADAIAGYTVANDVSVRDWQWRTSQWLAGKAFDATTPIGPVMVTADDIDPAKGLGITCRVNGEIVQHDSTSTLVFDAADLVAYVSQFSVLRPGDVILTGTPGGVGAASKPPRFLQHDDLLTTEIEGIGELSNLIRKPLEATPVADSPG